MKKDKPKFVQHGDCSFHPIDKLPEGLKKIDHNGTFVVAVGEATGHAHRIIAQEKENLDIFQDEQGRYYLAIKGNGVEIEHRNIITDTPAEHKTLPLAEPFYRQEFEEDFNPFTEDLKRSVD